MLLTRMRAFKKLVHAILMHFLGDARPSKETHALLIWLTRVSDQQIDGQDVTRNGSHCSGVALDWVKIHRVDG